MPIGHSRQWALGHIGNFPPVSVGSWAGGNNRKRARSAQRRVGPKARLTAGARVAREGELSVVRVQANINIYP
jgi:hypothetical protein